MFNKRGQKEMSIGTLLAIILGVVVLVVLILFFTGAFDQLGGFTDVVPGDLEAVAQSCRLAVQGTLITEFCYSFKEVGNNQYVNCEDARIIQSLGQQDVEYQDIANSCDRNNGEVLIDQAKVEICDNAARSDIRDIFFNGNTGDRCEDYGTINEDADDQEGVFTSTVGVPESIAAP